MPNILQVLLHTTRTWCAVLTLLSFIAAGILNTRVGSQPAMCRKREHGASSIHYLEVFFPDSQTSEVFGKAGTWYSLVLGNYTH